MSAIIFACVVSQVLILTFLTVPSSSSSLLLLLQFLSFYSLSSLSFMYFSLAKYLSLFVFVPHSAIFGFVLRETSSTMFFGYGYNCLLSGNNIQNPTHPSPYVFNLLFVFSFIYLFFFFCLLNSECDVTSVSFRCCFVLTAFFSGN